METVADTLSTATSKVLREGAMLAKSALGTLDRAAEVQECSASYLAGRIAAIADVLGYASYQTSDETVIALVRRQPYSSIVAALNEQAMRNLDLANHLGKDEAQISRSLKDLREEGAVTSHKRGREVYNSLTPVGRLVVEQGLIDAARRPIGESTLYDLNARRAPVAQRKAPPPRPSITGGRTARFG